MFWIQESAGSNKDNSNYKLFYAETETDTTLLPTNLKDGTQTNCDKSVNSKCAIGSECFVIESGSLKVLTSNGWQEV